MSSWPMIKLGYDYEQRTMIHKHKNIIMKLIILTSIEFEAFVHGNSHACLSIIYFLTYHLSYQSITTYNLLIYLS